MDKYAEAIDDFTKSINIKPSHKGYGNRGTSYALLKKYDLALNDFDQSLKYNADDGLANIRSTGSSLRVVNYASSSTNSTKEDSKRTITNFQKAHPKG
ncbi:tetratricopeptide repeat protein [Chryseobacterium sp. sg2396]|uniref:tetratricopeptide repeat protein n=1 Tax=Chryseobacterium sp. sg2396 TaxID=3276280 RepID=UPI0025DB2077|nr:tetratricopeptide repeat protein [uncultured Chryseobacterium sp.]